MLSSDFSGVEKPLVAGFMRGFRAWRPAPNPAARFPVRDAEKLRSSNAFYVWTQGRNTATCNTISHLQEELAQWSRINTQGCQCIGCAPNFGPLHVASALDVLAQLVDHQPPSMDPACNVCGFYALHSLRRLGEAVARNVYIDHDATVYGSIKATGTVIIGTKGFRAQYAEIEALAGLDAGPYAEYYGVPWFPEGLPSLAESFPSTPVDGIDEPAASRSYDQFTGILAAVNRVTISGFSPPITALVPTSSPDSVESDRDVPDSELVADPVPVDPGPAEWLTKWINTRVWRRG